MKRFYLHVFEISIEIDRSLYSILEHCLQEDTANDRILLSLKTLLGSNSGWSVISCKKGWSEGKNWWYIPSIQKKIWFVFGSFWSNWTKIQKTWLSWCAICHYNWSSNSARWYYNNKGSWFYEQNRIKISEIDSVLYKKTAFPS